MEEFSSATHGRWELQSPTSKCASDYSRCVLNSPLLPNNNEDSAKIAKLTSGEISNGTKLKNPFIVVQEVSIHFTAIKLAIAKIMIKD